MKTSTIALLSLFFCLQCSTNQQSTQDKMITEEPLQISAPADNNFLVGTWQYKEIMESESGTTVLNKKCNGNSQWIFTKKNETQLALTISTATGEDCNQFSTSEVTFVELKQDVFAYRNLDVMKTEKFSKISDQEFQLSHKDYIGGKMVEIKKIFTRK